MTEKELRAERNKVQSVTNILDKDFDFKWDWLDYTIKKGATENYPLYLAENCALHMARFHATKEGLDYNKMAGEIVDKIFSKKTIEYNKLTITEATALAKERKIPLEDSDGKAKNKKEIISALKDSH